MTLSLPRVRHYLRNFELEKLFVEELGWDRHAASLTVTVHGQSYTLRSLAEKRGVQIFECKPDAGGKIPEYDIRRKIEKQVTKSAYEHLIIFVDGSNATQIWQWVDRAPGRPAAYREQAFHPQHQSGDALIQKLNAIVIPLGEEEGLDLTGAVHKLRDAFDRDRVTKQFYDRFKKEHASFLEFIEGVGEQGDKEWYASLMLDRLMFVYFIQRKSFLDGNPRYLTDRLQKVQALKEKEKFLTFYRYFLLKLFHEGFYKRPEQRNLDPDLKALLGAVPYLNGGLFELHDLEQKYPKLDIPDEAFEKLFAFFDEWDWTLDTRPLRNDKEINPDVLGYIFEKYINQKQMGAYYTKEDITGYISKNTIVPWLLETAKKKCTVAFDTDSALWCLLRDNPDRYIYPVVRKGVIDEIGEIIPLPAEISAGLDDVSLRGGWNRLADAEYALPTETWREHVARRRRCLEVREKLLNGEIHEINDLVTFNLDIRQLAVDAIADTEGPELLRAFWQAIREVTVLDPTCGSGAFLFAALNILEPLYETCLERMQAFVEDLDRSGERHSPKKFDDFRRVLAQMEKHPNRSYFILKSIIIGNIYGVDIMEEAVEICKLRLFLKLVAQVDRAQDLEPLPDIDFNIRAGNTLVGFATLEDVKKTLAAGKFSFAKGEVDQIVEDAEIVERAFQKFHEMQTEYGMDAREFVAAKHHLRQRLDLLADQLDRYLAGEYRIDPNKPKDFDKWRDTHQPFHWFAEFYRIMLNGGFDVVIGNPPYVEYRYVCCTYRIEPCRYRSEPARNLYAFCTERSARILSPQGRFGMIIPSSAVGLDETVSLRDVILERYSIVHCSTYSIRPSKLFEGVDQRLCIIIAGMLPKGHRLLFTTRYHHWNSEERDSLFHRLAYVASIVHARLNRIVQAGDVPALNLLCHIEEKSALEAQSYFISGDRGFLAHYHRSPRYWIRAMDFEQYFESPTRSRSIHHFRDLRFRNEDEGKSICAIINSSLFFFWFMAICNGRNITGIDVARFPVGELAPSIRGRLKRAFEKLMDDFKSNSFIRHRADCQYQEFRPSLSKEILDKIDSLLAEHFAFSDEERDFVINFEIKYRMGPDQGDEE